MRCALRFTGYTGSGVDWRYAYDADGQLTSASSVEAGYSYRYDAAGNLTSGGAQHDRANRLLEDAEHRYSYDERGQLIEKQDKDSGERIAYSWDDWGRLTGYERYAEATATAPEEERTFSYGPLNRRWSRSVNGREQTLVYDGLDRIGTLSPSGTVETRITHGPRIDEPWALSGAGERPRYLHADHLGSIIGVTASTGITLGEYRYAPFGANLKDPPDLDNPFAYTAREPEGNGLYYYRARHYDTGMRRFLSEDPIGFAGGDTNLYAYVLNDPVNMVDPTGKVAPVVAMFIGAGVGAVAQGGTTALQGGSPGDVANAALGGALFGATATASYLIHGIAGLVYGTGIGLGLDAITAGGIISTAEAAEFDPRQEKLFYGLCR